MATLGIGFTLSASAAQLAGGINEAVKQFNRVSDAATETNGYFEALQGVDFGELATNLASGNWSAVASQAMEYLDAIGGLQRVFEDVQQAAYATAEAVHSLEQRAIEAGVAFQSMQVQDLLDAGVAREDILRLGLAINEINADRFYELAEASNEVEQSQSRLASAGESLLRTLVTPLAGLFEGFDQGAASIQNGAADIIGGLNAIADPIASVLSPFLDIIGSIGEALLRTVGVVLEVVGVILRLAGALIKVPLEGFAEGWRRIAGVVDSGVKSVFEWLSGYIDYLHKKIDDFYNFMSKVPIIGGNFASNEGGVPSAAPQEAVQPTQEVMNLSDAAEEAAREEEQAQQDLEQAIAKQEAALSKAIDQALAFGDAGFSAALKYQDGLRELNEQLERGILNETSYAQAAQKLGEEYKNQIKEIRDRTKAEKEAAEQRQKDEEKAKQNAKRDRERRSAKAAAIDEKMVGKQEEIDKIQAEKAAALNGKSNDALKANDIRSSEGMAQFIALATGREDPAIEENRKTNQKLEEIRKELAALQQEKVDILGAAA